MSYDYLKGRKCMVWTFMGNSRMYQALAAYGDRLSQVGLFSFKVSRTGVITESGVAISNMLTYINRWPHIKWLLTISNDGTNSIFAALRDNTDGAQDTFLSEIVRIMEKYPWCDGIDIDLEKGDGYSTHAASTAMFRNIYNTVKGYDNSKLINICLPGMNSINGSVGGENWCVYGDLNAYCDTAAIMSYGMAWAGSAPGAVSPALLSGKGTHAIADDLNRRGIPTKRNGRWTATTIRGMLSNEKYVGDCLFQKTYSDSRFVRHNNHGEQTQYMVKDHHEAIISREDFEAAHAFIHQRATEKGVVKGSDKYQNRYTFSGKIICGECGDTFKRRIHSCTGYKYTAWCCSTHIKDKDKCHMLFVKDDDLKQAFVTMMNKLVYAHRIILKPYVDALKNTSSDDSLRRIQEIQTLLAQNTEKRETLTKLMTQGIIDPILFNKETNELLSQADSFRDEINALKNAVSGDVTKVTAATALLHFTEKGGILQEFDDDLFNEYVNRIIVRSRNEVRFELKCGLTLRERM